MKTVTENNNNNKNNRIKRKEIQKRNSFLTFNRVWEVFWIKMLDAKVASLLPSSCQWIRSSFGTHQKLVLLSSSKPKILRENKVWGYSLWQRDGAENISWERGPPRLQSLTTWWGWKHCVKRMSDASVFDDAIFYEIVNKTNSNQEVLDGLS